MDTAQILASLSTDKINGCGVLKDIRMSEVKNKKTGDVTHYRYSMEVSKLNAILSIDLSEAMHTRLVAETSTEKLVKGKTFISYEAEVNLESDAFAWSNDKGSGAMATSKYGAPFLIDYKKVS